MIQRVLLTLGLVASTTACERTHAEPIPPADEWVVNVQPYFYGDLSAADTAYTLVATHMDWHPEDIEYLRPYIVGDIIAKESGGCPYVRGGTLYNAIGDSCDEPVRWGRRNDTGFGQVTAVLYRGKDSVVCKHAGLCSWQQILETPWTSMVATLTTFQHLGKGPWCYDKRARNYHSLTCKGVPSSYRPRVL
jgi:hypothetical protein